MTPINPHRCCHHLLGVQKSLEVVLKGSVAGTTPYSIARMPRKVHAYPSSGANVSCIGNAFVPSNGKSSSEHSSACTGQACKAPVGIEPMFIMERPQQHWPRSLAMSTGKVSIPCLGSCKPVMRPTPNLAAFLCSLTIPSLTIVCCSFTTPALDSENGGHHLGLGAVKLACDDRLGRPTRAAIGQDGLASSVKQPALDGNRCTPHDMATGVSPKSTPQVAFGFSEARPDSSVAVQNVTKAKKFMYHRPLNAVTRELLEALACKYAP